MKFYRHIPNFTDCSGYMIFEAKEYGLPVLNFKEDSLDDLEFAFHFITDNFTLLEKFGNKIFITSNHVGEVDELKRTVIFKQNYLVELNDHVLIHEYTKSL